MNYRCHKNTGICYGILTSSIISPQNIASCETLSHYAIVVLGSYIGSILPDIDSTQSAIGKRIKILSKSINFLYGHRGVTHYPITWVVFAYLVYIFYWLIPNFMKLYFYEFFVGFFEGVVSHIILDCFNSTGIKIFMPFSKKRIRIPLKPKLIKRSKKFKFVYLSGEKINDEIFCMKLLVFSIIIFFNLYN